MSRNLPESRTLRRTPALVSRKLLAATTLAVFSLFSCATIAGSYDDALSAARLGDSRQLADLLDRGIAPRGQTGQLAADPRRA